MIAQVLFWLCVALVLHAYFGYPLWLLARARWRPRPSLKIAQTPPVTAVVVVHDGAAHIEAKLACLLALDYPPDQLRVLVACDGCNDASAALARRAGDPRVRVLEFTERRGKAACLNDAMACVDDDIVLLTDVRQRLQPGALRALVANLSDASVGAVGGELQLDDGGSGFARGVGAYWRVETAIRRAESASGSTVGVSGALYALRRPLFEPLPPGTVLDDVLVPMRIARAGYRVLLEPAAVAFDRAAQEAAQERPRKIRTLAGNYQLLQLAPWLLDPRRNPLWFRFVSHKLLRLLAPWALAALLPLSALLAPHQLVYLLALLGLLGLVALALAGRVVPPLARLLPVRLATAFCSLNLFSAQGLIAFARNRSLHLW
ncbi:MAG TPA: glycosyltransferase family 2 protein [Rhodanobacteraceae bacterium]|nr:glycosyltransferase family 2 protein [Rhodanobacteraceae bacterium]